MENEVIKTYKGWKITEDEDLLTGEPCYIGYKGNKSVVGDTISEVCDLIDRYPNGTGRICS